MAKARRVDPRTARAEERWRKVIDDWRRSGLQAGEFCRERGVSLRGFHAWRRRLAGGGRKPRAGAPRPSRPVSRRRRAGGAAFLPVRVVPRAPAPAGIEIEFPTGHVLRAGAEVPPDVLARAVALLDDRPC